MVFFIDTVQLDLCRHWLCTISAKVPSAATCKLGIGNSHVHFSSTSILQYSYFQSNYVHVCCKIQANINCRCLLMHKECCFQWYNWNFWFSRATRFISTQILFLELCPWEHCWYCTFHKHLSMTLWIYKQPLYYLLHIPYNKKLS